MKTRLNTLTDIERDFLYRIWKGAAVSRTELAVAYGMARCSVGRIVERLKNMGFLIEKERKPSGKGHPGISLSVCLTGIFQCHGDQPDLIYSCKY